MEKPTTEEQRGKQTTTGGRGKPSHRRRGKSESCALSPNSADSCLATTGLAYTTCAPSPSSPPKRSTCLWPSYWVRDPRFTVPERPGHLAGALPGSMQFSSHRTHPSSVHFLAQCHRAPARSRASAHSLPTPWTTSTTMVRWVSEASGEAPRTQQSCSRPWPLKRERRPAVPDCESRGYGRNQSFRGHNPHRCRAQRQARCLPQENRAHRVRCSWSVV